MFRGVTDSNGDFTFQGFGHGNCRVYFGVSYVNKDGVAISDNSNFISALVPSAPLDLQFVTGTSNSGTLTWHSPVDQGDPSISDYLVQYSRDGRTWMDYTMVPSDETEAQLPFIQRGNDFYFRVKSTNGNSFTIKGFETLNISGVVHVFFPLIPPTAPRFFNVDEITASGFSIHWSAPLDLGGLSLVNYDVVISRDEGTTWTRVEKSNSTSQSIRVTGAAPGTHYLLRIAAVNSVGTPSDYLVGSVTTSFVAPSSPLDLRVTKLDASSVNLSWRLPSSNGGSPITDYLIEVSGNNGSAWTTIGHAVANGLAFDVGNLLKNHAYMFRVSAVNSVGVGVSSDVLSVSTPSTVSSVPTVLTVPSVSGTSVKLAWLAPSENGGVVIADYKVELSRDLGATWLAAPHPASQSTSLNISGLVPGAHYLVRISASNSVGYSDFLAGDFTTPAVLSTSPSNLQASNVSSTALTLSWGLPSSNGGSPIVDYLVEVAPNGSDGWVAIPHVPSNTFSFNVSNLAPGRTYQFRVSALNAVGVGSISNSVTVLTPGLAGPNAPASLEVSNVKTNAATVSWSSVVSPQKVSNYLVYVSIDSSTWIPVSKKVSTSTSLTLSGLRIGAGYQIRIAAVNANGVGDYVYRSFNTLATVASAPTSLSASNVSDSGFELNWVGPTSDGGSSISDCIVEINGGGFNWTTVAHSPSSSTSLAITGLNPGVKYSVRVKAINGVGASKVSSTLSVTTLAVLPSSPVVTLKSVTTTGALLNWVAPANGGAKISDYKVEYSTDSGNTWLVVSKSASTSTSLTLKNLKTKTSYLFRVSAKNSAGYSAPSSGVLATTP